MSGRDSEGSESVRAHLANERTLLAWMRTALTMMALGFVVNRLELGGIGNGFGAFAGIGLVLLGGVVAAAGGLTFMRTRRDISTGRTRSSIGLDLALVGVVVAGAAFLCVFLLTSSTR